MNSLNIITARVSPSPSPSQSRSNSISSVGLGISSEDEKSGGSSERKTDGTPDTEPFPQSSFGDEDRRQWKANTTEETPLLHDEDAKPNRRFSWWHSVPHNIASSLVSTLRWVFATIASPGVYLLACLYDDQGVWAPLSQFKKLFGGRDQRQRRRRDSFGMTGEDEKLLRAPSRRRKGSSSVSARPMSSGSSSSGMSSESEFDEPRLSTARQHSRSKSLQSDEEINPARRSIRIKLHNDESLRNRKHRKTQSAVSRTKNSDVSGEDLAAHIKSPTSPIAALTKYPKTPAPPRPLIPRRQPSYLNIEPSRKAQKTLILDLDETLIHSMSKGGRMSTGHMVEVRLNTATLGAAGQPQAAIHPILYWVNKRPHCDEFLKRVCKWYNLVIFTASVQEYADPVIDWLEQERKYFSARYYRQHCTYRQGAYIKDLSSVEPDLSKVMILDNSPLSYLFHEGEPLIPSHASRSRY